jgi:hypothetical protein
MFETTNQYTILERLFGIFFGVTIVASPQLKEKHVGSLIISGDIWEPKKAIDHLSETMTSHCARTSD